MCREDVETVCKITGLFFLLEAILFVFLFISFYHSYEMNMKILSSGFVSLFLTTLIWITVLLVLHKEENPEERKLEDEDVQELIEVQVEV